MRIGIISDTHNCFDPEIPRLFDGVDHILHAGDVGTASIIFELEQIAPVTAVLGNTDSFLSLKETEVVVLDARKFLLHHIVNPQDLSEPLKNRIGRERPDAVIFGHTHKPFSQAINGTLFFNPGYAGKSRFGMERTIAIVHCDPKTVRPEYLKL